MNEPYVYRNARHVRFNDWKGKKREEGTIIVDMDDGVTVTIENPVLWSDHIMDLLSKSKVVEAAIELVGGPEKYDEFVSKGGSANALLVLAQEESRISLGEASASDKS